MILITLNICCCPVAVWLHIFTSYAKMTTFGQMNIFLYILATCYNAKSMPQNAQRVVFKFTCTMNPKHCKSIQVANIQCMPDKHARIRVTLFHLGTERAGW